MSENIQEDDAREIESEPHTKSSEVRVWSHNQDTVGATFLFILCLVLLFALLRSENRLRQLLRERDTEQQTV